MRRIATERIVSPVPGGSAGIAWALDGDVLVIRIPLRAFARQIAEEALARI
jgi:hypothetical protein